MTGWEHKYGKKSLKREMFGSTLNIINLEKNVLKEYKKGKKTLAVVIKDLVNHPNCRDFVAERLCRFLITDEPTKEMKQPIIDAFQNQMVIFQKFIRQL